MKRTLLLCLCAVIATASSGSLLAARTIITTTERCYAPNTRVVRTYRVVPRTTYVYERDHRHGFSAPFRYVGGKMERFFTGRNTIDPW